MAVGADQRNGRSMESWWSPAGADPSHLSDGAYFAKLVRIDGDVALEVIENGDSAKYNSQIHFRVIKRGIVNGIKSAISYGRCDGVASSQ